MLETKLFHLCCPYTKLPICSCALYYNSISSNAVREKQSVANWVYSIYSYAKPEYEEEFGGATLSRDVSIPPSVVDTVVKSMLSNIVPNAQTPNKHSTSQQQNGGSVMDKLQANNKSTKKAPQTASTQQTQQQQQSTQKAGDVAVNLNDAFDQAAKKKEEKIKNKFICMVCGDGREPKANVGKLLVCKHCGAGMHIGCHQPVLSHMPTSLHSTWLCDDCKVCIKCDDIGDEEKLLLCDICDRGFHTYCLRPKLQRVPEGAWLCMDCKDEDKNGSEKDKAATANKKIKKAEKAETTANENSKTDKNSKIDEKTEKSKEETKDSKDASTEQKKDKETGNKKGKRGRKPKEKDNQEKPEKTKTKKPRKNKEKADNNASEQEGKSSDSSNNNTNGEQGPQHKETNKSKKRKREGTDSMDISASEEHSKKGAVDSSETENGHSNNSGAPPKRIKQDFDSCKADAITTLDVGN